jgi:hypothetical protein
MPIRFWLVGGVLAALVFAGCGSSHRAATSSTATASSTAQVPPGAPPALAGVSGRVLVAGELSGFTRQGQRQLGINADSWVVAEELPTSQRAQEAARLRSLGFVAGVREKLLEAANDGSPAEALSIVEQFRSPRAARTELAAQVQQVKASGHPVTIFTVQGIPGARGFGGSSLENSGLNIAFTKGPYYYLVGAGWLTTSPSPPSRAAITAAAQHLYGRVHA